MNIDYCHDIIDKNFIEKIFSQKYFNVTSLRLCDNISISKKILKHVPNLKNLIIENSYMIHDDDFKYINDLEKIFKRNKNYQ